MLRLYSLARLRTRVFRAYLVGQLLLDIGLPLGAVAMVWARDPSLSAQVMMCAGFIISATMSLMRLPAFLMAAERVNGCQDLIATTGVTRSTYLQSNLFVVAYLLIFPLFNLLAINVATSFAAKWSLWLTLSLLAYAAFAHGLSLLLVWAGRTTGALTIIANTVVVVTVSICPIFYDPEKIPDVIAPIVMLLPASLVASLARTEFEIDNFSQLTLLMIWASLAVALGYRLTPWRRA